MHRLPLEIVARVCTFLPVPALVALAKTAHVYRNVVQMVMLADDNIRLDLAAYIVSARDVQFLTAAAIRYHLLQQFRYIAVVVAGTSSQWPYPIVITHELAAIGKDRLMWFAATINPEFEAAMKEAIVGSRIKDDAEAMGLEVYAHTVPDA